MMKLMRIKLRPTVWFYKAGEFSADAGWQHKNMYHDQDFEIIFCLQGHFNLSIDGKNYQIKANECWLIPPRTTIFGTDQTTTKVDFFWVHFFADWQSINLSDQYIDKLIHQTAERTSSHDVDCQIDLPRHFQIEDRQAIILAFNQLLDYVNRYHYTDFGNHLAVQLLLISLGDAYLKHLIRTTDMVQLKTTRVVEWIRVNISSELTVASIADHFEMSSDYLTKLFKDEQGETLREYLITVKMEVAKLLLVRTNLPITAVATAAYFRDDKNFMKLFKKRMKMTAGQYRNNYGNTHLNNPAIDPSIPIPQEIGVFLESTDQ